MLGIYVIVYRLMELVDGEKGLKIIPYKWAEWIKVNCHVGIDKNNPHTGPRQNGK